MPDRRALVLCLLVAAVLVTEPAAARAQGGAASPQAAVAAWQRAATANDWGAAFALLLPSGRAEMARDLLRGVNLAVSMADPDDPILKDAGLPPAEATRRRTAFAEATAALRDAWRPHGMEPLVGARPLAPESTARMEAALATADIVALMRDTMAVFLRLAPALGVKPDDLPVVPPIGAVTGYKIVGNRATAKEGATAVDFARVDGRWYLAPPQGR